MGLVSSVFFGFRNGGKALHGDSGRAPVALAQFASSTAETASLRLGHISEAAQSIMERVDHVGKAIGVSNAATKVASIASKAVNPLLCAAAGYRVLKDDDKDKALIEEVCSMGAMFGGEAVYKKFRNTVLESMGKQLASKQKTVANESVKNVLQSLGKKCKSLSSGKQKALFIAAEFGFVGASILAYGLGKKFGQLITGRGDKSAEKAHNPFKAINNPHLNRHIN